MRALVKKIILAVIVASWLLTTPLWAQGDSAGLERVLKEMDAASQNFSTIEASLVWDEYQKVVNETETEKGMIYFRRQGPDVQMAVDFTDPDKKSLRYGKGKLQVYLPGKDEVDEYTAGKNRADMESYLVLGFGGSGHDLLKSYDTTYLGSETVNGVKTDKLELIPKSDHLRNDFIARILLWIDAGGISVQQQFFQPGESDYRLAKYSDIKIHAPISDEVFKLKTTKKTKFVSPQG